MSRFVAILATPVEVFSRELEGLLLTGNSLPTVSQRFAAKAYLAIEPNNTMKRLYFQRNI
jgi:hypothetical protein